MLRVFYPAKPELEQWLTLSAIIYYVLFQKILNVNGSRGVPWPVHLTSMVTGVFEVGHVSAPGWSPGVYVNAAGGVKVGKNLFMGPGAKILSVNHEPGNPLVSKKPAKGIVIGDNVWLGASCAILPGVTLGDRVTVGAGAVVTKDVPDRAIVAGVPAKIIGYAPEQ